MKYGTIPLIWVLPSTWPTTTVNTDMIVSISDHWFINSVTSRAVIEYALNKRITEYKVFKKDEESFIKSTPSIFNTDTCENYEY